MSPSDPIDLSGHGYRSTERTGLWSRENRPAEAFTYNDGDEHETWVGEVVRNATDVSVLSRELRAGIKDWPSRYHLSGSRANIVRPFLDTMQGPVLEIGAGMGAVTRAIGEAGHEVVAVEGSPRRAAICADRCRDLDNVQVVSDTVQGFGTGTRFGTIVVIGVLEYSRVHGFDSLDGRDPVDLMLEHLAGLLLPGGQLLLAIENQLGLKYFGGFPEDHVGRRMFGVEGRYGDDTVVTFGREELDQRLKRAGLEFQDWYFPFPDYKLPTSVVTERAFANDVPFDPVPLLVGSVRADHQRPATVSMQLERAWRVVDRNGLTPELANSFLVRASREATRGPGPVAWYFGSSARRPEFAKVTSFELEGEGLVVRRRRLEPHLAPTIGTIGMRLEDERYVPSRPWTDRLEHVLGRAGWTLTDLTAWFSVWLDAFTSTADLGATEGDPLVPGELLDALPRNLLVSSEKTSFIDLEWHSTEETPLSYLVFRALYDTLASLPAVARPAEGTSLVLRDLVVGVAERIGLTFDDERLAACWSREADFQHTVSGTALSTSVDEVLGATLTVIRDLDDVIGDADSLAETVAELSELREVNESLVTDRSELHERIRQLDAEVVRRSGEIERLAASQQRLTAAVDRARERTDAANVRASQAGEKIDVVRSERDEARHAHGARSADVERLSAELAAIKGTISWRVTRPLRGVRRAPRELVRLARGATRRFRSLLRIGRTAPPLPLSAPQLTPEAASAALDVQYYRKRYPDVGALDDGAAKQHFRAHGHSEGRTGTSIYATSRKVARDFDEKRESVVILFHDSSRTGAPVLGWNLAHELGDRYNVVAVLLDGGELAPAIEERASVTVHLDRARAMDRLELDLFAQGLREDYTPAYAVANSAATHHLASALERNGVPTVALVHEFASSMRPNGVLAELFETVSEVVFPAQVVVHSMHREYAALLGRQYRVVPQGKAELPPREPTEEPPRRVTPRGPDGVTAGLAEETLDDFLMHLDDDAILVIGAGTVIPRKGIEFFAQAADHARRTGSGSKIEFAWIGHRVPGSESYVDELWEQVERSGATNITFLAPAPDLAPLYDRADMFMLSSRLDPFPNVAIDAALAGIPVVAFDRASGFAEWLREDESLAELVVPHLDAAAAGALVAELADDVARRSRLATMLRDAARRMFDMTAYADHIDELGRSARAAADAAVDDVETILSSGAFSGPLFAGVQHGADPRPLVTRYVTGSRLAAPRTRPRAGILIRRPSEGFNPLVYAEQAPEYVEERDGDPFADFLRKGRPDGPWCRRILRPDDAYSDDVGPLSVLVHAHYHYPELLPELLDRLGKTTVPFSLVVTTTSEERADQIARLLRDAGQGAGRVVAVPNRGRDLGPLLAGIDRDLINGHDLLVHVHGKRSPHLESEISRRWSDFLLENVLGGASPMFDRIHAAFVAEPQLGLVYPEDPHLNDWDLNRHEGEALSKRIGLRSALPNHFDFPVGNMYWARVEALTPLFDAGLGWEDFPPEPLPTDGTVLHALERLTPFVVRETGFGEARTVVPGVYR